MSDSSMGDASPTSDANTLQVNNALEPRQRRRKKRKAGTVRKHKSERTQSKLRSSSSGERDVKRSTNANSDDGWIVTRNNVQNNQAPPGLGVAGLSSYGGTEGLSEHLSTPTFNGSYLLINGESPSPMMNSSAAWLQAALAEKNNEDEAGKSPGKLEEPTDWFIDEDDYEASGDNSEEDEEIARKHIASLRRISFGIAPGLSDETLEPGFEYKEINHKELRLEESPIGRGQFGTVYRGTWRGAKVAVKRLHFDTLKSGDLNQLRHEASLMSKLANHPNIVNFVGAVTIPPHFCLITAYYSNGSVRDYMDSHKDISWRRIVSFARDAAAGILHLHYEHVIHRDIAARNLLLDENLSVAVADFGLSRTLATSNLAAALSEIGPVAYMAPESIVQHQYSIKTDSFAFGVLLWELETRETPYVGMMLLDIALGVAMKGLRLPIRASCPPVFQDLMTRCWSGNPQERPDFVEIYSILDRYLAKVERQHRKQKIARKEKQAQEAAVKEKEVRFLVPSPTFRMAVGAPFVRETTTGLVLTPTSPEYGSGRRFSSPSVIFNRHNNSAAEYVAARRQLLAMSSQSNSTSAVPRSPNGSPGSPTNVAPLLRSHRSKSDDLLQRHLNETAANGQPNGTPVLTRQLSLQEAAELAVKAAAQIIPSEENGMVSSDFEDGADEESGEHDTTNAGVDSIKDGINAITLHVPQLKRIEVPLSRISSASPMPAPMEALLSPDTAKIALASPILEPYTVTVEEIVREYPLLHGGSSTISKGKFRKNQIQPPVAVAIKRLRLYPSGSTVDLVAAIRKQALILAQAAKCKYVVPFVGVSLDPDDPFIVTSWVPNGSLSKLRQSLGMKWWRRLRQTKPLLLVRIAHDIASACAFLHKNKILHRNLNASNILLDSSFHARISGFSAARYISERDDRAVPHRVDLLYRAPELDWKGRTNKNESPAMDVYSFSVLLWTLWTGKARPYGWHAKHDDGDMNMCILMKHLYERKDSTDNVWPVPHSMPEDWHALMKSCSDPQPEKRPSFELILSSLGRMWNEWSEKALAAEKETPSVIPIDTSGEVKRPKERSIRIPRLGRQISEDVLPTPRRTQSQGVELIVNTFSDDASSGSEGSRSTSSSSSGSSGSSGSVATRNTDSKNNGTSSIKKEVEQPRAKLERPNGAMVLVQRRSLSHDDLDQIAGKVSRESSKLIPPDHKATLRRLSSARTLRDSNKPTEAPTLGGLESSPNETDPLGDLESSADGDGDGDVDGDTTTIEDNATVDAADAQPGATTEPIETKFEE